MKTKYWLVCIVLLGMMTGSTAAQSLQKRILHEQQLPSEAPQPVTIDNLKVNGQSIAFDQGFEADEEWLRGLSFEIKNVSGKTITHLELSLRIAGTDGKNGSTSLFFFGKGGRLADAPAVSLEPNQVLQVSYSEKLYGAYKRLREHLQAERVNEATLEVSFAILESETGWRLGHWLRRDPDNAHRWLVIGREHLLRPQ